MPRRGNIAKRDVLADPIYNSKMVTRLINNVMYDGKKGVAQKIVYQAFDIVKEKTGNDPLEAFEKALENIMPVLECKSRRVGGANYQVPLEVRPAREGDTFVPFGGGEAEVPEPGEVVYVSNGQVRTRRWTWRQSEIGKITEQTRDLLFPIDGFRSVNYERTLAARADLARYLETLFGAKTAVGLVDKDNPVFEADI